MPLASASFGPVSTSPRSGEWESTSPGPSPRTASVTPEARSCSSQRYRGGLGTLEKSVLVNDLGSRNGGSEEIPQEESSKTYQPTAVSCIPVQGVYFFSSFNIGDVSKASDMPDKLHTGGF